MVGRWVTRARGASHATKDRTRMMHPLYDLRCDGRIGARANGASGTVHTARADVLCVQGV